MTSSCVNITAISHLALRLGIDEAQLKQAAANMSSQVTPYRKNKKSGGYREICPPSEQLKEIQQSINTNLLQTIPVPDGLHGSVLGKSPETNAQLHVNKDLVIKLDIEDFYPSIHSLRVYRLFVEQGCSPDVSRLLTRLTTFNHHLAQGFPTSSTIANLILASIWPRIAELWKDQNTASTSYQDDITISGRLPAEFVVKMVTKILGQHGFRIKCGKTRVMGRGTRQSVTGRTVNQKVNIQKDEFRRIRSTLYRWSKHGIDVVADRPTAKYVQHVRGQIERVRQVNRAKGDKLLKTFQILVEKIPLEP